MHRCQSNQNNMFTGNVYNVSINTPKETYSINSSFEANGNIDSSASFVDYVGSYTLFSFEDFGKFFIDIAISGSWEDYIPLSSLAKDSFDEKSFSEKHPDLFEKFSSVLENKVTIVPKKF